MATACAQCSRPVPPSVARACSVALGEIVCDVCRLRGRPTFPTVHQAPAGCVVTFRPTGFGRFLCELVTPAGSTFYGAGLTDALALSRARAAYTAAAP